MSTPVTHYLKDYQPPCFKIESVFLTFDLNPKATKVVNKMQITCLVEDFKSVPIRLDGEKMTLISIAINQQELLPSQYQLDKECLSFTPGLKTFEVEIVTDIDPELNTSLEGLYRTSGNYCTQCEAQGFRTITYFMDRPDVLSLFTTKIIASKDDNKVLLSNGNLIESGELEGGRHYAVWQDPSLKPCYLFALVAGNLEMIEDTFTTQTGRSVDLRIYVEPQNIDQCNHAMSSLKKAMQWDETRFGLSYDLETYMIVAVDDFNMGAMENKGLNVFNSKYVLGEPKTATDTDYEGIEAVIGHEYFHNWTGNRVTCRDWFQLTLKEGLTVFRDQEFTADMLSPAVKRISDVKQLRTNQFPEDAGPMSHPIQPQSYIEMNNFYTMTVYEKGAEVVRMYQTLLGRDGFRKGMDCYIQRHDGQAVTIQDFRQAMADANKVDLSQMQSWYVQAGTPHLWVKEQFNPISGELKLTLKQTLEMKNGQCFEPLLIPVKLGFISLKGESLHPSTASQDVVSQNEDDYLIRLTDVEQTFTFSGFKDRPVVSMLRDFSAPVILEFEQSESDLEILASYDTNSFVQWEAIQTLAMMSIKQSIVQYQSNQPIELLPAYQQAFKKILNNENLDKALKTLALTLPNLTYIGEQYKIIPLEAMLNAHQETQRQLAKDNADDFLKLYQSLQDSSAYQYEKNAIAQRMLKNSCLGYLIKVQKDESLAQKQYQNATNMTDALAALETLTHTQSDIGLACLDNFYQTWSSEPLVVDKWFALQAASQHANVLTQVKALINHPDFTLTNPNRVRSVLGVFGRNILGFHQVEGYQFLAEQVIALDKINPQVASRMVMPFTHWRKYDTTRQTDMLAQLHRILEVEGLSKDVYEVVAKTMPSNE